jgi:transcriptional regulator with XRE-family HTH domain
MASHDERRLALVALREQLRITQLDVARACHINRTTVSLWEAGFANLPPEALDRIEQYLHAELEKLKELVPAVTDQASLAAHKLRCIPLSSLGVRRPELES